MFGGDNGIQFLNDLNELKIPDMEWNQIQLQGYDL